MAGNAPLQTVWSPWLRLLHWLLAISMVTSFISHEGGGRLHEWSGYAALAAASTRVLLGFAGSGYWRFSQFVRSVPATLAYALDMVKKTEARHIGHNPLGGWMVLALLADAIATGLTGWLYTTDRFFGYEWLARLHNLFGQALIPLLMLHVAGVLFTSWRQRENLVAAMVHGKKAVEDVTE